AGEWQTDPGSAIRRKAAGSVALSAVPAVTVPPCSICSCAGFQIFEPAGGLKAPPYFQVAGSNGPWWRAPAGAVIRAPLWFPAGAASGNCVVPGFGLLA